MEYPIPTDWDGESWRRFCICWPDSPFWISYLNGFVTYFTRGRAWDGKTGSIIAAQAIGREIAKVNLPLEEVLVSCSEGDKIARSILFLAAVVGGFNITNISENVPDNFFDSVEFDTLGLANRIGPQTLHTGETTIQATLDRLEGVVGDMQSSNDNVAKAISMLTIAMTGQTLDFSAFDPNVFFSVANVDFTQNGLANRIGPQLAHNSTSSLSARMDQVREAIENLAINVNVEEGTIELPGGEALGQIVDELEEIRTVLETRSVAETEAQNTNFDDLVEAIQALELQCETIVNTTNLNQTISGGGCGTGGAGTWPADPSDQTTTPEDQAGDPPPGFESWPEFKQYQCDTAYLILNQIISDISVTGLLAASAASVSTLVPLLVAAFLTPIGWGEIIIIAGLFITLLAAGVSISTLTTLLEGNKDEFVCSLLSGTDVASSITNFGNLCDSKVTADETLGSLPTFLQSQISSAIKSYATIDSINRLYEKTPLPPPGGNDCSECGPELEDYLITIGTELSEHPANPIDAEFEQVDGFPCGTDAHQISIQFADPVTITAIENLHSAGGAACGVDIYNYFAGVDFDDPITSSNGRPQDIGPVSSVRSLYIIVSASPGDHSLITYEVE